LRQAYERRVKTVELLISIKKGDGSNDQEAWEWLLRLLLHLTPDGMSSDESDVDGLQTVYRVKIFPWRREKVAEYMQLIDEQRLINRDLWAPQGAKPVPRLRGPPNNLLNSTRIVKRLPASLYNDEWKRDRRRCLKLQVSQEDFEWLHLMTAS
jgi:hypothetical protein